jgi:CHAT domain-containing protein/tetratricopeptide (TPR) repeat protein
MSQHTARHSPQRGSLYLIILCLLMMFGASSAAKAPQHDVTALEPGRAIERDLKGGEAHTFRVRLASGQFLHAVVMQKGIDVGVTVLRPDGQPLAKLDSPNSDSGPEPVVLVAEEPGDYRLEVSSPNPRAPAGRYEIRIINLREATPTDRNHVAAEQAFGQAQKLRSQRTAVSMKEAIEKYREALPFFQSSGDRYRQALILNTIGGVHAQSSEFRKALEYFGQALPLWRAVRDQIREASTLNNMGGAHDVLGDLQKALEYYGQARSLFREKGNQHLEANTLNNIGKVYQDLADWQKALDSYNQALPTFRAVGDQRREAIVLHNIGVAYYGLGEQEKALEFYRQALPLQRATGDKAGEADTLSSIGLSQVASGEMQRALEHYNQALLLRRAISDRVGEAFTLDYIGLAQAALGEREKALEYHQQALQVRRAAGDRRGEASALRNLGHVHTLLGQPQKALEHLGQALALFQAIGDDNGTARTRQNLARAERARGNLAEARQHIEAALSLFEQVRANAGGEQLRASYLASRQDAYQFYIALLMQMHRLEPARGHDAVALQTSERARARSLMEMLTEARADIRQGADAALLERERHLLQQLNAKAERLLPLRGRQSAQEQAAALNQEISQLEIEYQQVQAAIRQRSPHYAAITQPEPLSLKQIQEQLFDSETLLLEYSLGEEHSYLWAVTKDALASYELPKQEEINQSARQVYELLTARSRVVKGETPPQKRARLAQAEAQLQEAARGLSQMLLGPVAAELGSKRLVVVADGALQYIPFAMLPAPKDEGGRMKDEKKHPSSLSPHPLIVDHEIISLPSASTLAIQRRELAGRQPAPKGVAVLADPVFQITDARLKKAASQKAEAGTESNKFVAAKETEAAATRIIEHLAEEGQAKDRLAIPRLPFTRQEAEQILAVAPGSAHLKAMDFQANRATALSPELSQYRYLHFATHGYLDSERPGFSALVLSLVDEQGRPQAGFLRANEVYNLKLPAELVVLSACQTGLGKEVKGEGLVGITRGFMFAGAARVAVSLWSVNDRATAELMAKFYQKMLKEGARPAAALRAAQVEMWKQKQWQSPYYWAAFVLQGEWQ